MLSLPIKEEKMDNSFAFTETADEKVNEETITLYTCANCTRTVALCRTSQLMCTHCVHRTGSSTVFYKLRTQPTTYDTV